MGAWIEVTYNHQSDFGPGWSTGSTRMYQHELVDWLRERLEAGKPVLITSISLVGGSWWEAKAKD